MQARDVLENVMVHQPPQYHATASATATNKRYALQLVFAFNQPALPCVILLYKLNVLTVAKAKDIAKLASSTALCMDINLCKVSLSNGFQPTNQNHQDC